MSAKQLQIAREAGKSFASVVKDYADAGHSMTDTAMLLGYQHSGFLRLCARQGWREWFAKGQDSIAARESRKSRRGVDTPALKRAREKRQYETVEYQGIRDTYAGHARRLGIPLRTVWHRKQRRPGELGYIFSVVSLVRPPKKNTNHWWRD